MNFVFLLLGRVLEKCCYCTFILLRRVLKEKEKNCGSFYWAGLWKKATVALFLFLVRVLKESSCCTLLFVTGLGFLKMLLLHIYFTAQGFERRKKLVALFYWAGFWKKEAVALVFTGQGFERKKVFHFLLLGRVLKECCCCTSFLMSSVLKNSCCTFLLGKVLKESNWFFLHWAGFWKKAAVALFLLLVRVLKESSCWT